MIAYPSVSVGAAVSHWATGFPGLKLLISEYNADIVSTWATTPSKDIGRGGLWMRDNADAGSHALHWASGVLAGINSNGTVSGINYHSLTGDHNMSNRQGFGIIDLGTDDDTVWFNAVAQLMSHLSALAVGTDMHAVQPGNALLQLADLPQGLVLDSQKGLPALQSAAFSSKSAGLVLVAINRGDVEVGVELELDSSGAYAPGCFPQGLTAAVSQYSALDPGGWALFDSAAEQRAPPWEGPMTPVQAQAKLKRTSATTLGGLVVPALSLVVAELGPCKLDVVA